MKEEKEKAGLNLNIQKVKIMASGTMTFWQIDGEKMETKSLQTLTAAKKLKDTRFLEEKLWPT